MTSLLMIYITLFKIPNNNGFFINLTFCSKKAFSKIVVRPGQTVSVELVAEWIADPENNSNYSKVENVENDWCWCCLCVSSRDSDVMNRSIDNSWHEGIHCQCQKCFPADGNPDSYDQNQAVAESITNRSQLFGQHQPPACQQNRRAVLFAGTVDYADALCAYRAKVQINFHV